jgi:SAM-dependent methyltransferase
MPLPLDASGERYIPTKMQRDVAVEHWHRYFIAARLVAGKRVLDIASGEGYGSHLLAQTAASVVGVDISADAVQHASEAYRSENLRFLTGSCAAIPLPDASVDAVVSFETLEHHGQHEEMLAEIKRVLVPGGLCVISTPDRIVYSEIPNYSNPYHVKELTEREFGDLMARHFARHCILGQRFLLGSILTGTEEGLIYFRQDDFSQPPQELPLAPKYLVALASDGDLPKVAASVLETAGPDAEAARLNALLQQLAAQLEANEIEKRAYIAAAADRQRERDHAEAQLTAAIREIKNPLLSTIYRHLFKKKSRFD